MFRPSECALRGHANESRITSIKRLLSPIRLHSSRYEHQAWRQIGERSPWTRVITICTLHMYIYINFTANALRCQLFPLNRVGYQMRRLTKLRRDDPLKTTQRRRSSTAMQELPSCEISRSQIGLSLITEWLM